MPVPGNIYLIKEYIVLHTSGRINNDHLRDELTKLFYKTYNKQLLDETQTRRLWFVTTGFVKIQEPVRPLFKNLKHAYIRHLALKAIKCLLPTLLSHASFDLRLWSVL